MPDLLITGLSDEFMGTLEAQARGHGRSVGEEAQHILERGVRPSLRDTYERAMEISERFRAEGRTFSDSTELIREDRDSR